MQINRPMLSRDGFVPASIGRRLKMRAARGILGARRSRRAWGRLYATAFMSEAAGVPPPQTFRPSLVERLGVSLAAIFMGAMTSFVGSVAIFVIAGHLLLGLFMGAIAAAEAALTALVAREAISRWRLRADLYGGVLNIVLPRRRGFIDAPREKREIALGDIEAIEERREFFSQVGVTTSQRAFALKFKDGSRLRLGADREYVAPFFAKVVAAIVSRTGARQDDLGAVEGAAGVLLVAGQSLPEWGAPSLEPAARERLFRRQARNAYIMAAIALVVVLAQAFSRG